MDGNTEERMELSDAERLPHTNQVENECWICGQIVMKARKLAKARCFDCRQKNNNEMAKKHYQKRFKAL